MREIKFRAWDTERHKMILTDYLESITFTHEVFLLSRTIAHVTHVEVFADDNGDPEPTLNNTDAAQLLVMQFTGLKDRNGEEIYEGDVLRHFNSDELKYRATVGYDHARFVIHWLEANIRCEAGRMEPLLWRTDVDAEVIGNIYENPELLEK